MARRARYQPNYKGLGKILASQQMQNEMENRAEQVKDRCEATSPHDSGVYAASLRVETGIRPGAKPRAESKVINDAPNNARVEWGTSRTPAFRVMGRAAGAVSE